MSNELQQVEAMARIPKELALLKMENDNIVAMAKAEPRTMSIVKARIVDQLEAFPEFASEAVYSKPVGKDQNGNMKFARGLSIRAAEALRCAYGYCRVSTEVNDIYSPAGEVDEDKVEVCATFMDYQTGSQWTDKGIVSKTYTDRMGRQRRHNDDRFYNVVVKAELSRRVRECICRMIEPGLRHELQKIAEDVGGKLLGEQAIGKMVDAFAELGVTDKMLEEYIGRSVGAGWTVEDKKHLQLVFVGLRDGETTIAEVFGEKDAFEGGVRKPLPEVKFGQPQTEQPEPAEQPEEKPPAAERKRRVRCKSCGDLHWPSEGCQKCRHTAPEKPADPPPVSAESETPDPTSAPSESGTGSYGARIATAKTHDELKAIMAELNDNKLGTDELIAGIQKRWVEVQHIAFEEGQD
jgi:hypothetical protein